MLTSDVWEHNSCPNPSLSDYVTFCQLLFQFRRLVNKILILDRSSHVYRGWPPPPPYKCNTRGRRIKRWLLRSFHVERSHAFPFLFVNVLHLICFKLAWVFAILSPSPRGDAGREQVWCQLYLKRTIGETPGVSRLRNDCPLRSPVLRHTGHPRVGTKVRAHKLCILKLVYQKH